MSYLSPKPGERYRHAVTGREYILIQEGTLINLDTGVRYAFNPSDPFDGDRNEFVRIQPPAEDPAPIKLVEGHDYQCRNGETTGLLQYKPESSADAQPWWSPKLEWWYTTDGWSYEDREECPLDIVKDLGPAEAPKHEPKRGDVYRHKERGSLYMVMRNGSAPYTAVELRCVGGGERSGNWWDKDSDDLFSGCEADFEYVGNDCLKV